MTLYSNLYTLLFIAWNCIAMDILCMWITGAIPQISFEYHFMWIKSGYPFNLTATVVSHLNLTSLTWSTSDFHHRPNRTLAVRHGNITTATFMLMKNASSGDSTNYILTAVNKCGQNSSQVEIEAFSGNWIIVLDVYNK